MNSIQSFIKIQYEKEIHMYNLAGKGFKDLKEFISTKFQKVPLNYQIKVEDWEKDWIIVSCMEDIRTLIEAHNKVLKFYIEEIEQEKSVFCEIENFVENHFRKTPLIKGAIKEVLPEICCQVAEQLKCNIMHNATCSNCGSSIIGPRYVCFVCENVDFCQSCEAGGSHEHPFLKIKCPEQMQYVEREEAGCQKCGF